MRSSSDRIWISIASNHQSNNSSDPDQENRNLINQDDNQLRTSDISDHSSSGIVPLRLQKRSDLVTAYGELVCQRVKAGWSCHLLTLLFPRFPGSRLVIMDEMKDQVERLYSVLVTRVTRRPKYARIDDLPILIGAIDLPVQKNKPTSAPLVRTNEGLHFHAILLIPRRSRLKESIAEHFERHSARYTGSGTRIQRIHIKPVIENHARAVDYVLKTITKGRLSYDDAMVILPRARQELRD